MPAQDTSRDAVSIGCGDQAIRDAGVSGERFRLDRDCGRHPDRSNIANERPPGQAAERRRDLRLHRLHPSYEALGFEDVEIGKRGGRGPGVARIGVAMAQDCTRDRIVPERAAYPLPDQHATKRHVAGRDALGEGDHVRLDPVAGRCPQFAGPTETRDHLVGDEQHVMSSAQFADRGPVIIGGRNDAACSDHGLTDECGDLAAPRNQQRFEALEVHGADHRDLVDERPAIAGLHPGNADERRAPGVHPVIGMLARYDHPLLGPTEDIPVPARQLRRRIDGIRAARSEEHDRVGTERTECRQTVREFEGPARRVRPERGIRRELDELVGHRRGDLTPAVTHVAVPECGGRIEQLTAVAIGEHDPVGRLEHDLGLGNDMHVGESVPEMSAHVVPSHAVAFWLRVAASGDVDRFAAYTAPLPRF